MTIILNGEKIDIEQGVNLRAFLESRAINPNIVACELNEKIIRRAQLSETPLAEGDRLEVIRMIGGG
jgi:sulfur carrier protein